MRRKILLTLAGIPLLIVAVALLYLAFGDLGRYRGTVERLVSNAIGRELTIAGRFEPTLLFSPRVVAEDVSLANPRWATAQPMVHVDRLEGSIDLWSLISGPIRITDVQLHGVRVQLAMDAAGRASWDFELPAGEAKETETAPTLVVDFDRGEIVDGRVTLTTPRSERPRLLEIERLLIEADETRRIQLRIDGHLDGETLALSGEVSPLSRLITGRNVEHDLDLRVGQIELATSGSVGELATLGQPEWTVSLAGPEFEQLSAILRVESPLAGPFQASASSSPAVDGIEVKARSTLSLFSATVDGRTRSLLDFDSVELRADATGDDLAAIGALFGLLDLPADAFHLEGMLKHHQGVTQIDSFDMSVRKNTLHLEGRLGQAPDWVGTELTVAGEGADLSTFARLARVDLPGGPYRIAGQVARVPGGFDLRDVTLGVGGADLSVDGTAGDYPEFAGTRLTVHAGGTDLSVFSELAGIELPSERFGLNARLEYESNDVTIEQLSFDLGPSRLTLRGSIGDLPTFEGTQVDLSISGPDLADVGRLANLPALPPEPFEIAGRLRIHDGYDVDGLQLRVGGLEAKATGHVGKPAAFSGTDLQLEASGPALNVLSGFPGVPPLPDLPFSVSGGFGIDHGEYRLANVDGTVGDVGLTADGTIGAGEDLLGTDLRVSAEGSDLSVVRSFAELPPLPREAFQLAGRLRVEEIGHLGLEDVRGELGAHRFAVDGVLGLTSASIGTKARVQLAGPDLSDLTRLIGDTGLVELPAVVAAEYTVDGRIEWVETGYRLQDVEARFGSARLSLAGLISDHPRLLGSDITLEFHGPDLSILSPTVGVAVPAESFHVGGRVRRTETGGRFDDVELQFGDSRSRIHGTLGEPPSFAGTDLEFHLESRSLALIGQLLDVEQLPDEPFTIDGQVHGTPQRFELQRFSATVGASDLSGSLRVDLTEKPTVNGQFKSDRIELSEWLPSQADREQARKERTEESESKPGKDYEFVLSDERFDLGLLQRANGQLRLRVGQLNGQGARMSDVDLGLRLDDGHLRVEPLTGRGRYSGDFDLMLDLRPQGSDYRGHLRATIREARLLRLTGVGSDPSQTPALDVEIDLSGLGNSLHELASSANGRAVAIVGEGRIENSVYQLLSADVLMTLLDALNPFHKSDDATEFECAVLVGRVIDGRARLDPIAMRTAKTTIVGSGKINFSDEKIDFEWASKTRKGIGISASTITNPFIKVSGRLGNPSLDIKPLQAVTATGVAVATVGLSIVARGFWDRVTAEKKVCKNAIKAAEQMAAEQSALPDDSVSTD